MPGFEVIDKKEKDAAIKVFDQGGILMAHGFDNLRKKFHVREFEKNFKKRINSKNALAISSGTAGLKIALKSLKIGPGDEVITQAFNFIATVEAIIDVGAKPIICNVDETLNMCSKDLKSLINNKTKAIIPVHMLGFGCDMKKIMKISKKYKISIIEDNCEALGGKLYNKNLGVFGDYGVFSFDFGKNITTGEGGMIITDNKNLDRIAREYHDHGHENNPKLPRGRDTKNKPGFNFRMTELQGAIGNVQLSKLSKIINGNKLRYNAFDYKLDSKFKRRFLIDESIPSFDTHIILVDDIIYRNEIISLYKDQGFGTKNLPDAKEWHCAYYWDHIFTSKEIKKFTKTKNILDKAIALPISLRKSKEQYKNLAHQVNSL